ncbi:hypothetical protein MPSEU_000711600 [Mayamaea pseudoterrestris]|nr:hypothetical protein MPSEU_000711600 [Mayamaea pseudoterrestris]
MTIQRLLIIHLKLFELSTGNAFLSDEASDDELTEHVLYYRNTEHGMDDAGYTSSDPSYTQELIEFASLCTALFSLSGALDASWTEDYMREVTFDGGASLSFSILEEPSIVAVIQTNGITCASSAVAGLLKRRHELFSLLRGGGIDYRLRRPYEGASLAEEEISITGPYPGMSTLYDLMKRQRKLKEQFRRMDIAEYEFHLATSEIERETELLRSSLPISSLREELRVFHDAFLSENSNLAHYGFSRSIVDKLLGPTLGIVSGQPGCIHNDLAIRIRQFLTDESNLVSEDGRIIAVSANVNGHVAATESIPNLGYEVAKESVILLMDYMHSFRLKIQAEQKRQLEDPNNARIRSLSLSLGTTALDKACVDIFPSDLDAIEGFLSPPPLALLSAYDDVTSFQGPMNQKEHHPSSDSSTALYKRALCNFDQCFGNAGLVTRMNHEESVNNKSQLQEEGCIIIMVDRLQHSSTVFLHTDTPQPIEQERVQNGPFRFFNFYKRQNNEMTMQEPVWGNHQQSDSMDVRYELASALSSDAASAFEDAMGEMSCSAASPRELLTSLAKEWMYAYTDGTKELYVIFDAKCYVTVADVEKVAAQLREQFFDHPKTV